MAQFVGKWVNDPSKTPKNYDEFMDKKGELVMNDIHVGSMGFIGSSIIMIRSSI